MTTTQLLGDVDGDGDIDQADALLLYAHIAINYIPSRWLAVADIDKDGSITLTDVFYIGAYILDPTNPDLPSGIGESTGIEIDESPSVEHPLPDSLGLIDYPDNPLQVEPGQTPQTAYVLQSVDAVRSQIDEGEFDYFRITLDDAAVIMVRGYVNGEHGAIDFSLHDHTGTMIGDEEWVSSLDSGSGQAALHMVQAWAVHNRLVLGQFHCAEALEEITIIPELLRLLDLKGCIGTTDALGCHKSTAEQVVEQAADYVLAVKANQPKLHADLQHLFDRSDSTLHADPTVDYWATQDQNHGRCATRHDWTTDQIEDFADHALWPGLRLFGMVEAIRQSGDHGSVERRYYIATLDNNAQRFGQAVRGHWAIENALHWVLDVVFNEDQCRIRRGHGPENMAVLRHIALNLLQQDKTTKAGIQTKRLKAGWDNKYLANLLANGH